MNSSFVVGLQYLPAAWKRALALVTPPDTLFYRTEKRFREAAAEKARKEALESKGAE
jgi:hypothetical protein